MARLKNGPSKDGYFGIGIFHPNDSGNLGVLWRSAYILGASFIFTIGREYDIHGSDTVRTWRRIPLYYYEDFDAFKKHLPFGCRIVAIEMTEDSKAIESYQHPTRCVYLLGSEATGISRPVLDQCHEYIKIPGNLSLNVSVAGSIILYDRQIKMKDPLPPRKIIKQIQAGKQKTSG